jgi:hypothetical protein
MVMRSLGSPPTFQLALKSKPSPAVGVLFATREVPL